MKCVAAAIKNAIRRPYDLAVRYGGEEFAVVLPATETENAVHVAEAIRTAVLGLAIPHRGAASGFVSVSIGAASLIPTELASTDLLIELADQALYRAKRSGRNRVAAHSHEAAMVCERTDEVVH